MRRRVLFLILSWPAPILVDALYAPFRPYSLYVAVAYGIGTVLVMIGLERRNIGELRDAWRETHPFQGSPVTSEVESDLSTTQQAMPRPPWRRKAWVRAIFWAVVVALSGYLLFLLALGGYPAPP